MSHFLFFFRCSALKNRRGKIYSWRYTLADIDCYCFSFFLSISPWCMNTSFFFGERKENKLLLMKEKCNFNLIASIRLLTASSSFARSPLLVSLFLFCIFRSRFSSFTQALTHLDAVFYLSKYFNVY